MEPSEEFCVSGCTCTFSLGPGSVVEEKVKKGGNSKKKKKTRQEKKRKNKQRQLQLQLQLQQKLEWGVGKGSRKKRIAVPSFPLFCHFHPFICCIFFFRLFPFAAGACAHTRKALKRTWCCNHLYQQGIEEIL